MSDVADLGDRITLALDRIRKGIAAKGRADVAEQSVFDALQAERATNKDLIAQITRYKEEQDRKLDDLTSRVENQAAQLQQADAQMQSLRAATDQLRDLNAKLRTALSEGLDPALLDHALSAEVEALRALRAADAAEVDAILAELKPLIEEAARAAD